MGDQIRGQSTSTPGLAAVRDSSHGGVVSRHVWTDLLRAAAIVAPRPGRRPRRQRQRHGSGTSVLALRGRSDVSCVLRCPGRGRRGKSLWRRRRRIVVASEIAVRRSTQRTRQNPIARVSRVVLETIHRKFGVSGRRRETYIAQCASVRPCRSTPSPSSSGGVCGVGGPYIYRTRSRFASSGTKACRFGRQIGQHTS